MSNINSLIPVGATNINNVVVNTINARDLHQFLKVGKDFSNWIKNRLTILGSVENEDYLVAKVGEQLPSGTKYKTEYYVTLNLAKHLAMMEKNEKGLEVRQYFIECEKKLTALTEETALGRIILEDSKESRIQALTIYYDNFVRPLKEELVITRPKAKYYDTVMQSKDLLTITQVAKDFGITSQKLNKILNEEGIQYKDNTGLWMLYSEYLSNNYAQTSTHTYQDKDGDYHAKLHLKWTQKGRLFIYDLLKSRGILPICEQE